MFDTTSLQLQVLCATIGYLYLGGDAMGQHQTIENRVVRVTERVSSIYVPPLQLTEGQPPPIAANGGLSYMSFNRDGDAGTAAATEAALQQLAEGQGQAVSDLLDN